jgi:hypothetical protein
MKCDEVQPLRDACLDSELDARTALEIEQHLKSCPNCARHFAEADKLDTRIKAGLKQGRRTAALWEQIERSVIAAVPSTASSRPSPGLSEHAGWHAILATVGEQLRAGWSRAPRIWAGLAAVWMMIFALHFSGRETNAPLVAKQQMPSASEMRVALKQKQWWMAELAVTSETGSTDKAKAVPPRPRSEQRTETMKT